MPTIDFLMARYHGEEAKWVLLVASCNVLVMLSLKCDTLLRDVYAIYDGSGAFYLLFSFVTLHWAVSLCVCVCMGVCVCKSMCVCVGVRVSKITYKNVLAEVYDFTKERVCECVCVCVPGRMCLLYIWVWAFVYVFVCVCVCLFKITYRNALRQAY